MKEQIKKAYKVIDSSSVYILHLIDKYIETLYNIGYSMPQVKRGLIKIAELSAYPEHREKLKADLTKLIEELLSQVDTISYDATPEEDKSGFEMWDSATFLSSVIYSSTFDKRVDDILDTLTVEMNTHIKAAHKANLSKRDAFSSFRLWFTSKDKKKALNEEILKAMDEIGGAPSLNRLNYLFDDMVNRGFHEANIYYWKQAGIRFKQIVAVVDAHTCNACLDLDGRVFPVGELVLPVHGHCRCEEYPVA